MVESPAADWASPPVVLVAVEEGPDFEDLCRALEERSMRTISVHSRKEAERILDRTQVDALIVRLRLGGHSGLGLLHLARQRNPEIGAVLIIDPGEESEATEALARGVVDFQSLPLNVPKVIAAVERILERQRLVLEIARLNKRLDRKYGIPNLLGSSASIARLISLIEELAPTDAPVLILGEPGSGKDFIARSIHQNSPRRAGPFVKVDCRALSRRLLEREIFGRPGPRRRKGRLEEAGGGTLYLDEVGAMPQPLQARIADAMRTGQIRTRLDRPPVEIDVRLIASSESSLEGLVDEGRFHAGLYGILSENRIEVPPLRHRRRDIPQLVRHFLDEEARKRGLKVRVSKEAMDLLVRYDWPGNVRELKSVVGALLDSATSGVIAPEHLPGEIREQRAEGGVLKIPVGVPLREAERMLIEATLQRFGGNRQKAAEALGIGLRTLYRRLREYGRLGH